MLARVGIAGLRSVMMQSSLPTSLDVVRGGRHSRPEGARTSGDSIIIDVVVPAHDEWKTSFAVELEVDGDVVEPYYRCGEEIERSTPVAQLHEWERTTPARVTGDKSVNRIFARSISDLGALRISIRTTRVMQS